MRHIILIAITLLYLAYAQKEYKASVIITGNQLSGRIVGTLFYSESRRSIRYSYESYSEIQVYGLKNDSYVYKKCPLKCDVSPIPNIFPVYYKTPTESCSGNSTTLDGRACTVCTRSSGPVTSICTAANGDTIRVTLRNGMTVDLSGITTGGLTDGDFDTSLWQCQMNCNSQLDIAFVVDESGSISGNYIPGRNINYGDWSRLRKFAKAFVKSFEIAEDKVHFSLIQFSRVSRKILSNPPHIIFNSDDFNKVIDGLTKNLCGADPDDWNEDDYSDCIQGTFTGYAILDAVEILLNTKGDRILRANVPKIIAIVTDGNDNYNDFRNGPLTYQGREWDNDKQEWATYAKDKKIKIVAVGVGDVDGDYLKKIASPDENGEKMTFAAKDFSDLISDSIINQFGRSVCTVAVNTSVSDCSASCRGQCICGACVCPTNCDTNDKCKKGSCSSSKNYFGGCLYEPIDCNDNNKCTDDTCSASSGCKYTNISCDDGDPCTIDECKPTIGCIHRPKVCSTGDVCKISTCIPATGACTTPQDICTTANECNTPSGGTFVPKDCTQGDKCRNSECNITTGCVGGNKTCSVGNACSLNSCDSSTGECVNTPRNCNDSKECTEDSCHPVDGCINTPVNVTNFCNDYDICTNDYCDNKTGCYHENVTCPNNYNDTCIEVFCDPIEGCTARAKQCFSSDPDCFVSYCNNGTCVEEELETCEIAGLITGLAAGLSAGIIAAIVIAAIVFAGGAAGGAAYVATHGFDGTFTNKSDIYEKETQVGQNPAFDRESVFNQPPVSPDA